MKEDVEKEEEDFTLIGGEEESAQPQVQEEVERHHGETLIRKRYPHSYSVQLSSKENAVIQDLMHKLDVDSLKDLLHELTEQLADKDHPEYYIINVNERQKALIEKVKKQLDVKDNRELMVGMAVLTQEEHCPKCDNVLVPSGVCINCAKAYQWTDEDVNEELEELEYGETKESSEEESEEE